MAKTNLEFNRRLSLGISACMYGAHVRYNGRGWEMLKSIGRESSMFTWTPVCPEIMSGMGVPRNPISIQGGNGDDILTGKARVKQQGRGDVTDFLLLGSKSCLETLKRANIDAYIFMEGSPSCGVFRTSLKNRRIGNPPGVFGAMLIREGIFLIPAQDLQSPVKWWDWRRRLITHAWLKEQKIESKEDLYELWHIVKFICQELNEKWAREFGNKIAQIQGSISDSELENFRNLILELLRQPSDVGKIKQWMWKNYSYIKKQLGHEVSSVLSPEIMRNMTHIAKELVDIEVDMKLHGGHFGSSPVIYKPDR